MVEKFQGKAEQLRSYQLPESFYQVIVADIPADAWLQLLKDAPHRCEQLFKGYSTRPDKLRRHFQQPAIRSRLLRMLREDASFLAEVLDLWGVARLRTMVFLEMLEPVYLLEALEHFKDLIGPERFFAVLFLLGLLSEEEIREAVTGDFWQRRLDAEALQALVPVAEFYQELLELEPRWQELGLAGMVAEPAPGAGRSDTAGATAVVESREEITGLRRRLRAAEDRREAVETKLGKLQEEHRQLQEQLQHHRREQEELRGRLAVWEAELDERLRTELDRQRLERWGRYQGIDEMPLRQAAGHLDELLRQADRAFDRQRQADAEFGSISTVRQQLLQVELYLREMERVYADSLVIHADLARAKDALLRERDRILKLPGIDRVLQPEPALNVPGRLRQRLELLDPLPANLPKVMQLRDLVKRLHDGEFTEEAEQLAELVNHKQHQILETLYARFHQGLQGQSRSRAIRNLDDLIRSAASKDYDIFVDGYNILLLVHGADSDVVKASLTALREQFIAALVRNGHWFHRVVAVFDGVQESRERRGNVEIVYADRNLGNTADAVIIRALQKRSSQRTLLVTADREIIDQTTRNVYAVVDPCHFYSLLFDLQAPL